MPKLLGIEALGERPIASPVGAIPAYRGASGAETVGGESLMKFGAALERTGNVIYEAQKVEQERFDKTAAEDAFNTLRERQLDLTVGEQNGFVNKKGKAAVDGTLYPQYTGMLDETYNELSGKLTNDKQRELFKSRAGIANLQYRENLLRHITEQGNVLAKQTTEGGLTVELKGASLAWRDPNAIGASLVRSEGLLKDQAEREGWADEILEAKTLEQKTRIHASVINNALANDNWGYAQTWYKKHKAEIVDVNGTIKKALEEGGLRARSQQAADKILAEYREPSAALEAVKQIGEAQLRDAVSMRVRQGLEDIKHEDVRARNTAFMEAANVVEKTGDYWQINPATTALFGPSQKAALMSLAEHVRKGTEPKQNDEVYLKFIGMGMGARAQISEAELLTDYRPYSDGTHWNKIKELWKTAKDAAAGNIEAQAKVKSEITFKQRFTSEIKAAKLLPDDKTIGQLKGDDAALIAKLQLAANDEIVAYKRAHNNHVPPEEEARIIRKNVLNTVFVEEWGKDPRKLVSELTANDLKDWKNIIVPYEQIPTDRLVSLKTIAKELKTNPSERQYGRAYAAILARAPNAVINAILTGKR